MRSDGRKSSNDLDAAFLKFAVYQAATLITTKLFDPNRECDGAYPINGWVRRRIFLNKTKKIRLIYGIVLSVLTVAVGIVFIVQAADIYYSGESNPYTVESVKSHLLVPTIFLCVWIAAAIAGYVLSIVFPLQEKRARKKDYAKMLDALKPRISQDEQNAVDNKALKRMLIARNVIWGVAFAVLFASGVYTAAYAFNPAHYHSETLKADILDLVRNVLGWAVASLVCAFGALGYEVFSLRREVKIAKSAVTNAPSGASQQAKAVAVNSTAAITVTATVACVAVAMFASLPAIATALVRYTTAGNSNAYAVILSVALALIAVGVGCVYLYDKFGKDVPKSAGKIIRWCLVGAFAAIALSFVIVGAFDGGARDVLIKAINICTECIGLG